jgi:hypothetical protein
MGGAGGCGVHAWHSFYEGGGCGVGFGTRFGVYDAYAGE